MKKILLLSDTHSYIDDSILNHCAEADEIWHAGDFGSLEVFEKLSAVKVLMGVYGNIDGNELRSRLPLHNRFTCDGMEVWITHIGGYPGKYDASVSGELEKNPPQLFICGHSHILKIITDKKLNLLHINPGAAGKQGLHQVRTMVKFNIHEKKISGVAIIELGKK